MSFTLINAVNTVLRELGEPPVASTDEQYPTLDLVLPAFDSQRVALLSEMWWFNTFQDYSVQVDGGGLSPTPVNTLQFYPDRPGYIWTGTHIKTPQGENPGQVVKGRLVVDIDFDDIPLAAQDVITFAVAVQIYSEDVGGDDVLQGILSRRAEAFARLTGQHTRQMKVSSLRRKPLHRWRTALQRWS